jgi:membrane protein YdbS with pleckstrin-like domain
MKGNVMFWIFLLFVTIAVVFAQLGAYSVWFSIFKGGLFLAVVVIVGLAITLLWRQVFGQKNN